MIFYLSATGNSLWAARKIAEATNDRLVCMTEDMDRPLSFSLEEDERVGFVFPVHGWRPPLRVLDFISRLALNGYDNHYTYALVTAGDNIGETIRYLEESLVKRGIKLQAAFSIIMPESYVGLPFMDTDTKEKERKKIDEAARQLEDYSRRIADRIPGNKGLVIGRWPRINSRVIGGFFTRYLITDKPFRVDEEKCLKCGKCEKVCPVGNITCKKGEPPVWNHNGRCMACFACYHHCPANAIQYGNRTKGKGQYFFKKQEDNK